ncbi:hypothetical protein DXA36_07225 [Eisenbergiella sp. OF01-20]|nr:hypothetical protein DXA36_07225 [Eisenbergiella sp. OF01-20]
MRRYHVRPADIIPYLLRRHALRGISAPGFLRLTQKPDAQVSCPPCGHYTTFTADVKEEKPRDFHTDEKHVTVHSVLCISCTVREKVIKCA